MTDDIRFEICYGKAAVNVYRTYGAPLTGISPVPESPFTGRDNTRMAAEIEIQVRGQGFLESYTEGDNRQVVATGIVCLYAVAFACIWTALLMVSADSLLRARRAESA